MLNASNININIILHEILRRTGMQGERKGGGDKPIIGPC